MFSAKVSRPQVLYVGETFNKKSRFSGHKQILKATTLINRGINPFRKEYIAVYFLHIRFTFTGYTMFNNNPLEVFQELKDISSKTSVKLLERLYIKLFNPPLNIMHNNDKFKSDNLISKKLIDNDIKYVYLDIGMIDKKFQFFSSNTLAEYDGYTYDLKEGKIYPGYPDNLL